MAPEMTADSGTRIVIVGPLAVTAAYLLFNTGSGYTGVAVEPPPTPSFKPSFEGRKEPQRFTKCSERWGRPRNF